MDFIVPLTTEDNACECNCVVPNTTEQMKDSDLNTLNTWVEQDHDPNKLEIQLRSKAVRDFRSKKS